MLGVLCRRGCFLYENEAYMVQAMQAKKVKTSYWPCSIYFNLPKINFCNFYSRKADAVEWI